MMKMIRKLAKCGCLGYDDDDDHLIETRCAQLRKKPKKKADQMWPFEMMMKMSYITKQSRLHQLRENGTARCGRLHVVT